MIKFAPKQQKHVLLSIRKEKQIHVFKYLLGYSGKLRNRIIEISVWKYLLHFHAYLKGITSLSRTRNICIFSGRTRGIYRSFQISRMKIREKIKDGTFLGVSKSS